MSTISDGDIVEQELSVDLYWSFRSPYSYLALHHVRALSRAYASEDLFTRFAASGLAIMFGTQACINMAVNLHLMPAKGMTLPFISYGGSSMVSLAYGIGMLLALTRQRPSVEMDSMGAANAVRAYA